MLWPLWLVLRGAFRTVDGSSWTLWHVLEVFRDPATRGGLLNALSIACCVTLGTLLLATPLALVSARLSFPGKGLLNGLLLIPLVLPPFVGAIGLRHLLGREGALNALLGSLGLVTEGIDFTGRGGFWAIVLLETLALYPIVYLNLTAALANLDPALDEAASNLGAGAWTRFRRVTLPLVRPGVFAGAVIVLIWSFTELGTPLMFEYRNVTSVQIFDGLKDMEASRRPFALVAVMLTVALGLYLAGKMAMGGKTLAMEVKAGVRRVERRTDGRGTVACWLLMGGVIAIAGLPHVGTILASLAPPGQWYGTILPSAYTLEGWSSAMSHPLAVSSIRNSLILSIGATAAALAVGLIAARLIVRGTIRGRGWIDALVMLPLAVPGLVMAFGFIAMSLEWPFGGVMPGSLEAVVGWLPETWGTWIRSAPLRPLADLLGADPNPFPLLAVAYAVRRMPYTARSAVAGLQQTSVSLEEAAQGMGAGRFRTMRKIVVPLVAANLVAGALLAFSFSMLEVSDSLVLAQRERDFPITKAIYMLYDRLGDGETIASAMGVWAMALLAVTLLWASAMVGKKMGALFRA
ncbi:MAG: iron ABC transporter permease [Planctomycetes bacterium]|nr:iron ABC transporter permease [Planctomycetota bacterium]